MVITEITNAIKEDPLVVPGIFPIVGDSDEETKALFYDHFIIFL